MYHGNRFGAIGAEEIEQRNLECFGQTPQGFQARITEAPFDLTEHGNRQSRLFGYLAETQAAVEPEFANP
jgi:hypothetical protein